MQVKATNTILYCKNWVETVGFYRDGLKFQVNSSNEWFVEFKLNDLARLSVADHSRTSIRSAEGRGITISLQVEHIKEACSELRQAGLEPSPIKTVWGSKVAYLRDPEGNRLEFWSGQAKT